ncbi:MAG: hypothetical protein KDC84_10760 [Crocinitomicaceae bacterium]|nr:hypothetical protein [Crocinitomicaceae bacterium]
MGVKIHKCSFEWKEIENSQTDNLCRHCKVCVPDLSDQSTDQVEEQFYKETCARVHDRHLEENRESYFFINKMESRLRKLGWMRLASVLVFVYLLVTGCYSRRTAGVPAYGKHWDAIENQENGATDQNSKMPLPLE